MIQSNQPVILTIDDEPVIRKSIHAFLEDYDFKVLEAENGRVGLEVYRSQEVDLILVDLRMPEMGGLKVLSEIRRQDPELPIIVVSGAGDIGDVVEALRLGATDYLLKPIDDMSILVHAIEKGLERAQLLRENRSYQDDLEAQVACKTEELITLNDRLRGVVESTKHLLGCGEVRESGVMILEEFGRHMKAGGGSIYEVVPNGLHLIHSLDEGHAARSLSLPLKAGSVFSRALAEKEPFIIRDMESETEMMPSGWHSYTGSSCIVFPFVDRSGDVFAVLTLHDSENQSFIPQDREIGAILASHTCEVLQTAKAMAAMQRSEELMLQAQKMEAVGTLAGGIAHDFNNILSAIVGYTDLSLFSEDCSESLQKNLQQVKKASQRARDLVRQILSFSRVEESREAPIDISPIIKEALKLLRASLPSSITIEKNIPSGLGLVKTDPSRIHQVLMNLCTNAAHAMQATGGTLRVEFAKEKIGRNVPGLEKLAGKDCLRLTVADTGCGMPANVVGRIFDPYYTTKEQGEGTGLGLAVVHGIVMAADGAVRVDSEVGKGSSFYVYLPCAVYKDEHPAVAADFQMPHGNEKILFVDDEKTLAEMAGEMLKKLGYTVEILSSSVEAKAAFERNPTEYDLVITDQTMPGISGLELARSILDLRTDIPVILYTGYSAAINGDEAKKLGIREFMMKPLSMTHLSQVVRKVLDEDITSPGQFPISR